MIASILARTCSVVAFDALDDSVRERFDFALPFIRTSNCEQHLRALLTNVAAIAKTPVD
jgi:hypothetical protein